MRTTADSTETTPAVSVVMSVYNAQPYLKQAIDSVLAQTFRDFEFVIIEDGSTDGSVEVLELCAAADPRIRLIRNPRNLGLTRSLNIGLKAARGRHIARMDADDVSLPERLGRQVAFLDGHPDHILVGTSYRFIDDEGRMLATKVHAFDDLTFRWTVLFRPPVRHPTVMFRREKVLACGLLYDESLRTAQDYELWSRMIHHGRCAILKDVLLLYRTHAESVTSTLHHDQVETHLRIVEAKLARRYPHIAWDRARHGVTYDMYLGLRRADAASVRAVAETILGLLDASEAETADEGARRRLRRLAAVQLAEVAILRGKAYKTLAAVITFIVAGRSLFLPLLSESACRIGCRVMSAIHRMGRHRGGAHRDS